MSVQQELRPTTEVRTGPEVRRTPRPEHPSRWLLPAALALLAAIAIVIGFSLTRSDDTSSAPDEPLIVSEEQAYIDSRIGPMGRSAVSAPVESVAVTPADLDVQVRPQGVPGVIDPYEWQLIVDRNPGALGPTPASTGSPTLVDPFEQAYIDGEYQHPNAEDWCLTHMPC